MTAVELSASAKKDAQPPARLSTALRAMWCARAGRWNEAHDLCQEIPGRDGSWIHAWLHREEGDLGNAAYWYHKAGKPVPSSALSLAQEWMDIAADLCERH